MEQGCLSKDYFIKLRILHVTIMFATALFLYQFSRWEDALWIPITVLAIIGPFRPGYTIDKARQRILGSIAGLLLSVIISTLLHYNYYLLVITAVILLYFVAFTALLEYKYFIMMVTLMICVNFDYLNLPINHEVSYITDRGMCVFVGIMICQFYEYFIFRHYYRNAVSLVGTEELDNLLQNSLGRYLSLTKSRIVETAEINDCIIPLINKMDELGELEQSAKNGYSDQSRTLELTAIYKARLDRMINTFNSYGFDLLQNSHEKEQLLPAIILDIELKYQ